MSRSIVIALVIAIGVFAAYRWWTADQRAIAARLSTIGRSISVNPPEAELTALGRVAGLRQSLSADVRISVTGGVTAGGVQVPAASVAGREAILALVSRWVPPPRGVHVEFADVAIRVHRSRHESDVTCMIVVTSHDHAGQRVVDTHPLRIGLAKIDGAWLVTTAALEARPAVGQEAGRRR